MPSRRWRRRSSSSKLRCCDTKTPKLLCLLPSVWPGSSSQISGRWPTDEQQMAGSEQPSPSHAPAAITLSIGDAEHTSRCLSNATPPPSPPLLAHPLVLPCSGQLPISLWNVNALFSYFVFVSWIFMTVCDWNSLWSRSLCRLIIMSIFFPFLLSKFDWTTIGTKLTKKLS